MVFIDRKHERTTCTRTLLAARRFIVSYNYQKMLKEYRSVVSKNQLTNQLSFMFV